MMGFARRGSWQLSITHTHRTRDEVRLGNAGIPLDLLNGDVLLDPTGISTDELELNLGGARNGFGGRLTARWRSSTEAASALDTLRFSDLTTVGLRLFADLGLQPIAREYPLLRGARLALIDTLRAAGWRTAAFTEGGYVSRHFGIDRGFERFEEEEGKTRLVLSPRPTQGTGTIERTFDAAIGISLR